MITIKSHFAFSGINIPSTINCSINSYFKDDQLIQQINFPTIPITEPLGQNYIKSIINNNLKTLDNNLTELTGLHAIPVNNTQLKISTPKNGGYLNLSPIRFQLLYYLFTIFRLSFHNNNIILNDWET